MCSILKKLRLSCFAAILIIALSAISTNVYAGGGGGGGGQLNTTITRVLFASFILSEYFYLSTFNKLTNNAIAFPFLFGKNWLNADPSSVWAATVYTQQARLFIAMVYIWQLYRYAKLSQQASQQLAPSVVRNHPNAIQNQAASQTLQDAGNTRANLQNDVNSYLQLQRLSAILTLFTFYNPYSPNFVFQRNKAVSIDYTYAPAMSTLTAITFIVLQGLLNDYKNALGSNNSQNHFAQIKHSQLIVLALLQYMIIQRQFFMRLYMPAEK